MRIIGREFDPLHEAFYGTKSDLVENEWTDREITELTCSQIVETSANVQDLHDLFLAEAFGPTEDSPKNDQPTPQRREKRLVCQCERKNSPRRVRHGEQERNSETYGIAPGMALRGMRRRGNLSPRRTRSARMALANTLEGYRRASQ